MKRKEIGDFFDLAVRRRLRIGLPGGNERVTDSFRVVDGEGDGLPGIWIDIYGKAHWVIATADGRRPTEAGAAALARKGVTHVWWKRLDQHEKDAPELLGVGRGIGPEGEKSAVATESGVKFEVDFSVGYSQGIFLDQRENRLRVRKASPGQRVLNLFSYTCAFSAAAAAGGAITTSLDLSPNYLDWGKRNLQLNGWDPDDHYFCKGDAFDWLRRFTKSGRSFGGVVIDPPTFSRGPKGKVFRAESDFDDLVEAAAGVVEREGWILATTNCRRLSETKFLKMVRAGLRSAGRRGIVDPQPMPPEYRGEPYLKTAWIQLE